VVQPGAGHCPWLDDPEWFTRQVAAFLDAAAVSLADVAVPSEGVAVPSEE